MLFQQIYNWLKFKTLTPSVIFKNRLFIERDLRVRRISNNMGWILRSSKWLQYSKPNLFLHNLYNYLNYIKWTLLILAGLYILTNPIIFTFIINFLNYMFSHVWLTFENFTYYITFIIWLVSNTALFVIQKWTPLQRINLGESKDELVRLETPYFTNFQRSKPINLNNFVIANWLFAGNNLAQKNIFFVGLSDSLSYLRFYHSLYNVQKNLKFVTKYSLLSSVAPFTVPASLPGNKNFFILSLYSASSDSIKALGVQNHFSLNKLLVNKFNLIYLNTISSHSFNLVSNENSNWINPNYVSLTNQFKTFRWFYKYSTLHRQSFKAIDQLTSANSIMSAESMFSQSHKSLWLNRFLSTLDENRALSFKTLISKQNVNRNSNSNYLFFFNRAFNFQTIENLTLKTNFSASQTPLVRASKAYYSKDFNTSFLDNWYLNPSSAPCLTSPLVSFATTELIKNTLFFNPSSLTILTNVAAQNPLNSKFVFVNYSRKTTCRTLTSKPMFGGYSMFGGHSRFGGYSSDASARLYFNRSKAPASNLIYYK